MVFPPIFDRPLICNGWIATPKLMSELSVRPIAKETYLRPVESAIDTIPGGNEEVFSLAMIMFETCDMLFEVKII